jgi:hypothetical protein
MAVHCSCWPKAHSIGGHTPKRAQIYKGLQAYSSSVAYFLSDPNVLCAFLRLGGLVSDKSYNRSLNTFGEHVDPGGCSFSVLEIYPTQKRVTGAFLFYIFCCLSTGTHGVEPDSVAQLVIDGLAARFDLKLRYESRVLAYHAETRTNVPTKPANPNLKFTFAKTSLSQFFSSSLNTHPLP